ncbi:hypothetical protein JOB18_039733 [Solea senegalensis]|uniref:Uncharacterized protein n=1 Tax=Solea senegalensis TaxID=28829 RepID=A0AAV6RN37_SOLSE|nr:hypothetical protein JOB18_039733 [Solea senegalensis]
MGSERKRRAATEKPKFVHGSTGNVDAGVASRRGASAASWKHDELSFQETPWFFFPLLPLHAIRKQGRLQRRGSCTM